MSDEAERIAAEVMDHIKTMYPVVWNAAHSTARASIRNTIIRQVDLRIAELEAENKRLMECLREVAPAVLSANFANERYPMAYSVCKALAGEGE